MKNSLDIRSPLLHLFITRTIKVTVAVSKTYHCYQPRTKCNATFRSYTLTPYVEEILQILIVGFDEIVEKLIKYSTGIKCLKKTRRNWPRVSANCPHEDGLDSIRKNDSYVNIFIMSGMQ